MSKRDIKFKENKRKIEKYVDTVSLFGQKR